MTIPLFQRLLLWIFSDTISGILILENDSFLPFCSCFSLKQNINEMAFLRAIFQKLTHTDNLGAKFLNVNKMWDFWLFIEQDIKDKK